MVLLNLSFSIKKTCVCSTLQRLSSRRLEEHLGIPRYRIEPQHQR